jgi:hypothetical protein
MPKHLKNIKTLQIFGFAIVQFENVLKLGNYGNLNGMPFEKIILIFKILFLQNWLQN